MFPERSVIAGPVEKGMNGIHYSRVLFSRNSDRLGTLRAVISYCFEPQINFDCSNLAELKRELELYSRFFNIKNTYPTILELPKSMGSARVKDWWISRHAVLAVLKAHYDQNFSSSSLAISISHTANAAIAILSTEVNAIGVDIEPAGREINDCVIDRIKHPKDIRMSDRIDCWVTKEAVLKASRVQALHEVALLEQRSHSEYLASVSGRKFVVVLGGVPRGYRVAIATSA